MRIRPIAGALLLAALAGCDDVAPPLDELPLRDALRADPAVIAALSDDARRRLATRLEAARAGDDSGDAITGDPATTQPAVLVTEVDAARAQRSSDALIVGAIDPGRARALASTGAESAAALPPLEVEATAPALTELESRALQGQGAALLRGLCAASGAHHLHRVVGWPIGAVAIGDTVYVGAAWLAALVPTATADGGADAGPRAPSGAPAASGGTEPAASAAPAAAASAGNDNPDAGGIRATPATDNVGTPYGYDGGVIVVYPPPTPQPPPTSSDDSCSGGADSCAACAAASSDNSDSCDGSTDDGSDSCDSTDDGSGSDDSCNNTSDGSDDSCNNTGSDGSDDTNCQVSRRSRQHGGTSPRMMLSVFAPLAFLLSRRQRRP